jgi:hypothetical protein
VCDRARLLLFTQPNVTTQYHRKVHAIFSSSATSALTRLAMHATISRSALLPRYPSLSSGDQLTMRLGGLSKPLLKAVCD